MKRRSGAQGERDQATSGHSEWSHSELSCLWDRPQPGGRMAEAAPPPASIARSWASLLSLELSAWPSPMTGCCAPSPECPAGCPRMACEWLSAPCSSLSWNKGFCQGHSPPPSIHLPAGLLQLGKKGATPHCSSLPVAFLSPSSPQAGLEQERSQLLNSHPSSFPIYLASLSIVAHPFDVHPHCTLQSLRLA